jgi:hypothetical protein
MTHLLLLMNANKAEAAWLDFDSHAQILGADKRLNLSSAHKNQMQTNISSRTTKNYMANYFVKCDKIQSNKITESERTVNVF